MNTNQQNSHQVKGNNLVISIVLNVVITAAQIVGGILSGSLALLSDALHNFSDVLSLLITYIAQRLSKKKATYTQTFGLKRAEIIAAFINALTLLLVAIYLIYQATLRFQNPIEIQPKIVILLAILGIVVNGFSVLLLKKDANHNLNMKSAYLHLFTDMLASVAVLLGGIAMYYFQIYWIDSLLTILIALYLIYVGYDLLKESTKILMLFTPKDIQIQEIVKEVGLIKGVGLLHHIHVWYLNETELHLEAHLDCTENMTLLEFDNLLQKIEIVLLQKFKINHTTIQPEFKKADSKDLIVQD